MSTLDIVLNIMAEKVDISAIKITVDTKIREDIFDDIFSLVIDIDDMLDITIADEEIDKIITVGDVINCIENAYQLAKVNS